MSVAVERESVVGQKRRFHQAPTTSVHPRQADILSIRRHVSNVPDPDITDANQAKEKAARRRLSIQTG
jgi:hypothetical protein